MTMRITEMRPTTIPIITPIFDVVVDDTGRSVGVNRGDGIDANKSDDSLNGAVGGIETKYLVGVSGGDGDDANNEVWIKSGDQRNGNDGKSDDSLNDAVRGIETKYPVGNTFHSEMSENELIVGVGHRKPVT